MNIRGKMGGSTNLYVEKVFGCLTRFRSIFTTNIHKDICVQQFVFEVVLTIFRISSVCAMLFDPEGSQKGAVLDPLRISLRVRVYMFCLVNIERIWFYTHLVTANFVPFCIAICQSCE